MAAGVTGKGAPVSSATPDQSRMAARATATVKAKRPPSVE